MTARTATAAESFHRLHREGLLVLANAWDAGSARLIESLGARALATSSCAVAWAHGFPDGDALPVPLLVSTVASITRITSLPLTVDMEGGYSDDPKAVGEAVARVIDTGGVGINLEDGTASPELLAAKIEQAKQAGAKAGVNVFVNARTDVFLRGLAPRERRIEETLQRAERYRAAGADGLFAPGVVAPDDIRALAAGTSLPLNVMARPGLPGAAELVALDVRRLSAGGVIAEVALGKIAALTTAFLKDGASDPLSEGAMSYAELNGLFQAR